MKMYKYTSEDGETIILPNADLVKDYVEGANVDEHIEIDTIEMTQEQYDALPEGG